MQNRGLAYSVNILKGEARRGAIALTAKSVDVTLLLPLGVAQSTSLKSEL